MRILLATAASVLALGAFTVTANAQVEGASGRNAADCTTTFQNIDKNNDGVLTDVEMGPERRGVPTTLSTSNTINQADFMRECSRGRTLPGPRGGG